MSFNSTIDNIVFEHSMLPENAPEKPFVQKYWTTPIYDKNTSASYNSNQIIFDSSDFVNSDSFQSYQEGILSFPLVIMVTGPAGTLWDTGLLGTDFMLGFKNSHTQLIHSVNLQVNNIDILQPVPYTNAYLSFIQHSTLSLDDEVLNGPMHGYSKDNSTSWTYKSADSYMGRGLCNNANFKVLDAGSDNDVVNEGLLKRQKLFNKLSAEKQVVLGDINNSKKDDRNGINNTHDIYKYYYYDCIIRLKDLCPNFFNNFPLTQNVKIRLTLTLNNNVSFSFTKAGAGTNASTMILDAGSFTNNTSLTNPLMIASDHTVVSTPSMLTANAVAGVSTQFNSIGATANAIIPCGSANLPNGQYKVTLKIGSVDTSTNGTGGRSQCILFLPSYVLFPTYLKRYTAPGVHIKKIYYTNLEYQTFIAKPSTTFSYEIASSVVRPVRLIMIPIMSGGATVGTGGGNEGLDPMSSPWTTEPATTSPLILTNFNCSVASTNMYQNDITYSFDHYLQSLNGSTGINSNLISGMCSSRINMVDFQNNYHYVVVDLSRTTPDKVDIAKNVKVRGTIQSLKDVVFHCFIEKENYVEIDVMTGVLIPKKN